MKELLLLSIIFLITVLNFDYIYQNGFGGAYFFKLSNIIFENNYLFFVIYFFSLLVLSVYIKENFYNLILILLILFLYNLQYTVYIKYYDPLLLVLFFLLFDFSITKNFFENKFCLIKIYIFSIIVFLIFFIKNNYYSLSF